MILKNMTAGQAVKSKAMIGGVFLIGAGVYLLKVGQYDMAMLSIGNGLGIMGIRDAAA